MTIYTHTKHDKESFNKFLSRFNGTSKEMIIYELYTSHAVTNNFIKKLKRNYENELLTKDEVIKDLETKYNALNDKFIELLNEYDELYAKLDLKGIKWQDQA